MNGHPNGSGFVRFEDSATCERAIGNKGTLIATKSTNIKLKKNRKISWLHVWWSTFRYST